MNNQPIAFFICHSNDLFQAQQLTILLSGRWNPTIGDVKIYKEPKDSIRRSIALYAVRCLPKHTWINDNNRFIGRESEDE
jgi:hypothetical protein